MLHIDILVPLTQGTAFISLFKLCPSWVYFSFKMALEW
ncbi:hypothetical protein J503_2924 [Acinetobacter baumannii 984213]|nr:hypothetical protein J503_2924 [Acinetobacter baumannii 984213]